MKNLILIALVCVGQIISATAQNTPNQNRSTTKPPDTTYFNSSNIVTDPTIRAAIEESSPTIVYPIDDRSNADRPNATINVNPNQPPPKTTNSNNPNSNKIVTDPAYNAKTYQDKSTISRDNTPTTPPNNTQTTRTSPNVPSPNTARASTAIDSTANTRSGAMPSNATNGNMNNANYAGSTPTAAKSVDSRYRTDIDAYMNWSKNTKAVYDESHAYVAENLNKMATAIAAMSMSCSSSSDKTIASNKNKIMANAKELQKDPHATTHARLMRESFIAAADMLKSVQQSCGQSSNSNAVMQMAEAARKMDAGKTTYSQEQHIRDFLQKANTAIVGMSGGMGSTGNN